MSSTQPDIVDFRKKVYACLLGKAIGGTLGMPFEGYRSTLELSYYDPVPTKMLPNDDLDLQVVSAVILDQMAQPRVDRMDLCKIWDHQLGLFDEYGVAKRNLTLGLYPPSTGSYDNWFTGGMGAAIRTELWACLAAGNPELAAAYAYEDACMDHATEGIYAAQFIAALEALAFVETNIQTLLDSALKQIPSDSLTFAAVQRTRALFAENKTWRELRKLILREYGTDNFTWVVPNIAFIVLGLLIWQKTGDYGQSLCVTVGCGEDTDCTGATLGSIIGIVAPDAAPEKWSRPLGDRIVLSDCIQGITGPATLDELTDLILSLKTRIGGQPPQRHLSVPDAPETGIVAEVASLDWTNMFLPHEHVPSVAADAWQRRVLPGTWMRVSRETLEGDLLLVKYPLQFTQDMAALVMVNSPHWVRVWADGRLILARDGGEMTPAFHRAPVHQLVERQFSKGQHEIILAIKPDESANQIEWLIGLGRPDVRGRAYSDWLIGQGLVRAKL